MRVDRLKNLHIILNFTEGIPLGDSGSGEDTIVDKDARSCQRSCPYQIPSRKLSGRDDTLALSVV